MAEVDRAAETELVRALAAGSEEALAAIYDRHVDGVYAAAMRLTADRGIAEEVVQETFLALWNRAELFDPQVGSLAAWLHTIARNRTVDRLRAAGRRPTLIPLSSTTTDDETDVSALDRVAAAGLVVGGAAAEPMPDGAVELSELRATITQALSGMPEQEREVIVLAYRDGLTQAEIAGRLGWPLGTVKTRTRRALGRLRSVLEGDVGRERHGAGVTDGEG